MLIIIEALCQLLGPQGRVLSFEVLFATAAIQADLKVTTGLLVLFSSPSLPNSC